MIERHVTFDVLHGKEMEFERFFKESYRPAMAQIKGFVRAELLQEQKASNRFLMLLRFETLEAASSWRRSELHAALKPQLKSHYNTSELKEFYVLVD